MYGSLDISTSGMVAQRVRHETIMANIANQNVIRDAQGNLSPFKRRMVMFAPGAPGSANAAARSLGVHVSSIELDPTPPKPGAYDPDHPDAFPSGPYKGYIATTNINLVIENVNALEAGRAYEANVAAAEATKTMLAQALRLLA